MNTIVSKRFFSENVAEIVVEAPLIARSRKAGHFVIVRVDEKGERMPLTISDADVEKGTITLVVQRIGVSSSKLCALEAGDRVANLVGPLGKTTDIRNYGTVVCACGGVGAAPMLPIAQALKAAGNRVVTILAARNKDLIILYDQLKAVSDEIIVMTDDGSMGMKGLVTQGVEEVILREKVDKCITIGPAIMMKFVALTTKKYNIPTEASLNTIMVDGTGMCGACRVTVGGKTKFVCVDGPEFDAHVVDFDGMLKRLGRYKTKEMAEYEAYLKGESRLNSYIHQQNNVEVDMTGFVAPFEGKAKDRVAIPRVKMNELAPKVRIKSLYDEVNQGLTFEQAVTESHRCLNCKNPTCMEGCPVNINIPGFIKQLEIGNVSAAADIISESSTLPAVCGRVCPQEKQCEAQCIHVKMGHEPVAIGYLERFVADNAVSGNVKSMSKNGRKVAVVGSGPAGLAFAGDMAKYGYDVTVFEALHEIGGVLKYGIPEFRLPKDIVKYEVENHIKSLNCTVKSGGDGDLQVLVITQGAGKKDAANLVDKAFEYVDKRIPVIIIDPNTGTGDVLQKELLNRDFPLSMLLGYSCWNTAANAMGIALSNGISRYSYLKNSSNVTEESHIGFLQASTFGFLKDISYKHFGFSIDRPNADGFAGYKYILGKINSSRFITSLAPYRTSEHGKISADNYRYPWDRTFEMTFTVSVEKTPTVIYGDVNGDGRILVNDYLMSKRIEAGTKTADKNMLERADINGDGKIDKNDYEQIKKHVLEDFIIK